MQSGDFPVQSIEELARAIAGFKTRFDFVQDYKKSKREEIMNNPAMQMKLKTLDSDRREIPVIPRRILPPA